MKHMIISFKMKGEVISDLFLMLWFQKDSLNTVGFRTYGGGSRVLNQTVFTPFLKSLCGCQLSQNRVNWASNLVEAASNLVCEDIIANSGYPVGDYGQQTTVAPHSWSKVSSCNTAVGSGWANKGFGYFPGFTTLALVHCTALCLISDPTDLLRQHLPQLCQFFMKHFVFSAIC